MFAYGALDKAIRTAAHELMNADITFYAFQVTAWVFATFHQSSYCVGAFGIIILHGPLIFSNSVDRLITHSFAFVVPVLDQSHFVVAFTFGQFDQPFK